MATYTDNYNLTKPTMNELADIRVINGNMDTVDTVMHGAQVSIADAYDPTQTYDVDDLVMNDFLLYKCITAVTVPEAFDANKWQRTTAVDEGGGGGNANERVLTQAEYNALTPAEKMNGTTYYISDAVTPSAGGIDYSTTEQNTGLKWIDGKDIYQKTFSLTSPSNGTSTDIIDISSLNVDRLPFIYASIKTQHNETYANGGSFLIWSRFDPNLADTIACQITNSDYYSSDMIVTIQYTKTTSS